MVPAVAPPARAEPVARFLVRAVDRSLRRRMRVFEYSRNPHCVFRARLTRAAHPLAVPGGSVPAGAPVLELHLWNERVPPLPEHGPDLAWAARSVRLMRDSCRELAERMQTDPVLGNVEAVGGVASLFTASGEHGADGILQRLGFRVSAEANDRPLWENLHAWLLVWTFNRNSIRPGRWQRMRRAAFWTTRERFLCRFGGRASPP